MERYHVDWVGVLDGRRLLGWVAAADLPRTGRAGDAATQRFAAWVRPDTPLREALDLIIDSQTRVAPVFDDDDEYLGMLTVEEIAEGIAKQKDEP